MNLKISTILRSKIFVYLTLCCTETIPEDFTVLCVVGLTLYTGNKPTNRYKAVPLSHLIK